MNRNNSLIRREKDDVDGCGRSSLIALCGRSLRVFFFFFNLLPNMICWSTDKKKSTQLTLLLLLLWPLHDRSSNYLLLYIQFMLFASIIFVIMCISIILLWFHEPPATSLCQPIHCARLFFHCWLLLCAVLNLISCRKKIKSPIKKSIPTKRRPPIHTHIVYRSSLKRKSIDPGYIKEYCVCVFTQNSWTSMNTASALSWKSSTLAIFLALNVQQQHTKTHTSIGAVSSASQFDRPNIVEMDMNSLPALLCL